MMQGLERVNIFEGVIIGLYGGWIISLVDKISFEKNVWFLGLLYQPLCMFISFLTLLLLFAYSLFAPRFMTRRRAFLLGFGHVMGNYCALYAEGWTNKLTAFFWIGTSILHPISIEIYRTRTR